jgi:hypothetical protein
MIIKQSDKDRIRRFRNVYNNSIWTDEEILEYIKMIKKDKKALDGSIERKVPVLKN